MSASITGGQRFLLSTANSLPMVLASVSSRCTERSAATSGAARRVHLLARRDVSRFRGARDALGVGKRGLRRGERGGQRRQVGRAAPGRHQAGFDVDEFGGELFGALAVVAQSGLQLIAPGGEIGQRAGEFGEGFFRSRQRRVGVLDALVDAGQPQRVSLRLGLQRRLLGIEAFERGRGVGRQCLLAFEIGGELFEPAVEFGDAFLGARLFAFQRFARHDEPLLRRRGPGFAFAQRRQSGGEFGLPRRSLRLFAEPRGDDADGFVLGVFGVGDFDARRGPAQVMQQGLGAAHLAGNVAVAHRLAGLRFQSRGLGGQLPDHVLDAQQVLFGSLEPQFGFMAPGMQAGNTGGFFQHAPPLVGPRLDDFADAALMHERRRARTGGRVGKQHRDVAGAHFAAVDAEGRALFADDAARDFEALRVVEGRRRIARAVVDLHRHFGVVARRTLVVAGEDDVVHLGRAHRLVGGLAHDPAHRLHQIRLAAAVGADDTGQSGFDDKIGRFDEGFEADQAKPRELHARLMSVPLAATAKGIMIGSRPGAP